MKPPRPSRIFPAPFPRELKTKPTHECGVFAVFGHPDAAMIAYYGLFALQHRGQESAGIVTAKGSDSPFAMHKSMGLVAQVFQPPDLERLTGTRAIGHVRYSTTGSSNVKNAQPFLVTTARGQLAIGHNGNLVNAALLREELEAKGSIFQTTVDSEIILHLLAQPYGNGGVLSALRRIEGAFSVVLMGEREIIGFRDPHGFRPLCIGKKDGAYILSSESCAFDLIQAQFIREVEPGEVVIIDNTGIRSEFPFRTARSAFCIFEYVYFARPDSNIGGINVSKVRVEMGRELARQHPVEADLVVPVPDSGIYASLGFSEELGIPYYPAFVRNHYIGRTFIQPTDSLRRQGVALKYNTLAENLRGQRVVVIDDSIVRGNTAGPLVKLIRDAGAREVHMRITCPPIAHPCFMGVDMGQYDELIAHHKTIDEMREHFDCDTLHFLSLDGMMAAIDRQSDYCNACFTGVYPLEFDVESSKTGFEKAIA